jgi:clathrin heavy chain
MQLYSVDKRVSQILNGHTGTFAVIKRPGRDAPAQVLCFEEKKIDSPAKLFVMEVHSSIAYYIERCALACMRR